MWAGEARVVGWSPVGGWVGERRRDAERSAAAICPPALRFVVPADTVGEEMTRRGFQQRWV